MQRMMVGLGIAVVLSLAVMCGMLYNMYLTTRTGLEHVALAAGAMNNDTVQTDGQTNESGDLALEPANDNTAGAADASAAKAQAVAEPVGAAERAGADAPSAANAPAKVEQAKADSGAAAGVPNAEAAAPSATDATMESDGAGAPPASSEESAAVEAPAEPSTAVAGGKTAVSTASAEQAAEEGASQQPALELPTVYTVQEGDSLTSIAAAYYGSAQYVAALAEYNHLIFINTMKAGTTLELPTVDTLVAETSSLTRPDYTEVELPATYLVQSGDTLIHLSKQFYGTGAHAEAIALHNGLDETGALKAGSSLEIPALENARTAQGKEASPTSSASSEATAPASEEASAPAAASAQQHTVQKGETLYSIALLYYGSASQASLIVEANTLQDSDRLKAGDVLVIPATQ
ncbi:LysM peptidoglycan-binding domain-containing protein [Paenibacillus sp. IB182496]|uniref:LysM peptidoglycan-binding domain-containing protein n=1 Tax=Paenibacillus sabuli TaxID=2772509 RepID=A0A927BU05_9BACL|nr:LysM domain-containing protein [Paenibacillus sabuli]MBD2845499.1 LysM peptidoglycan-binding domain-containing protein [Paenibacillus sabuli]